MSFELLLEACRIDPADSQLPPETLSDLTSAYELAQRGRAGRYGGDLPHAVTLLAAALGRLPRFNPTHLPFGYSGPHVKSREWVDLDHIELLMTQVIGLCQAAWDVRKVDFESKNAISDAASLGLIQTKDYDGWVPGMASGSGWRTAISATPYGLVRARQAAATTPPVASLQQKAPPAPAGTPASGVEAPVPAEPLLVETGSAASPSPVCS